MLHSPYLTLKVLAYDKNVYLLLILANLYFKAENLSIQFDLFLHIYVDFMKHIA